ncbi:hypothetical protein ACFQU9_08550 [Actinomadura namibiensis]
MAARRRRDREVLTARFEEGLRAVRDALAGGAPAPDPALRYAVNTAAMTRLSDLSVTPRDLRALLGLDGPAERDRTGDHLGIREDA